ncbi:hypothetical protein ACFY1U_28120 [Streptomyces sp. NPDC001351]|uniref:hypothetical protein n=1 Tax=Streptomyces sp. NPDC001351 TaxID=3364564 RepID=UPI00367CD40F
MLAVVAATATLSLASPVASYADDSPSPSPSASSSADAATPTDSPSASPSADDPTPTDSSSTSATSQEQYQALDDVVQKYHPLGVYTADDGSLTMVALPADTPPADESQLESEFPAGMNNVKGYISQFTQADLDTLVKTVSAKQWNADAAPYFVGVSYDAKQDEVKVNTDAPDSVTQPLLDAYPGKIEVEQNRYEETANRFDATSPYYGGMAILNTSGVDPDTGQSRVSACTTGVAIEDIWTGQKSMLTAGHCGKDGDRFVNRHTDWGWGAFVGTMRGIIPNLDAAELRGSQFTNRIWTGGTDMSASRKDVQDAKRVFTGLQVCVSGSVSMNHCGHPVTSTNFSVSQRSSQGTFIDGGNGFAFDQGGRMSADRWIPGRSTTGGDSGAPIYTVDANAHIAGILSGQFWNPRGCGCWTMVGVKIGPILNAKGADLVRGDN